MEGEQWPVRVQEEERAQQLLDTATKIKSKYGEVRRLSGPRFFRCC